MKYGLELQSNVFPPWRLSYVAYDVLKQELKSRQLDHGWTDADERDFVQLLDNELTKVYDFVTAKLSEIDARILYCERTIQTLQSNPTMQTDVSYSLMDEALTEILFDVNDLSRFSRVNYVAIQKILKKHDRWTMMDLKQAYVQKLRDRPLDNQRFDVAIVYISALHDICRNRGNRNQNRGINADGSQNAFERATAKYWIHPDNITEVKAIIMLHLPVLVFDKSKKWEPSDSAVSSVYIDNDNFDLYTGRLQRDEGAEAIRLRWYGPYESKSVYVERKTHHAPWLNGASVKDRFRIDAQDVNRFLQGTYTADQIADEMQRSKKKQEEIDQAHFIAQGVQTSLKEKELQPILRVFYNRTAFQLPDDQKLRISLDTNLTFIREDHLDGTWRRRSPTSNNNWRREDARIDTPFRHLPDDEILRFPYAVLETKLQTHLGQEAPTWLTSLVESHLVHEVPRFSKYLHGASHFYRDNLPLLPWWLAELNVDIRKPRAENTGLTRSRSFKPLIDGRYRRAMIEERERANQDAVVRGEKPEASSTSDSSNAPTLLTNSTTPRSSPAALQFGQKQQPQAPPHLMASAAYVSQPSQTTTTTLGIPVTIDDEYGSKGGSGGRGSTGTSPATHPPPPSSQLPMSGSSGKINNSRLPSFLDWSKEQEASPDRKKVKVRVEPKVFFANERTFISWLQFCALLLTVALSLLNFGDGTGRIVGGLFIGLAAGVAIYALYRFEKRAYMINRRIDGRYDDLWGPAVLCVLLVGALIVNFYLRFR